MLREFNLTQIEADVVIVLVNKTDGIKGRSCPLWECDLTEEELLSIAAKYALLFSEEIAGGFTDFVIMDYRDEQTIFERKEWRKYRSIQDAKLAVSEDGNIHSLKELGE